MPRRKLALFFSLFTLLACFRFLGIPLAGQTFYGSVVGTVNDASGGAMQGATATLINNGTGERRIVTIGADGSYRFVNLVPGAYKLEIEQPGFRRYNRDEITVEVESALRVDVAMQVGDVTQAVEVQSEAALLQTENASLSQMVAGRAVQEIPLNGRNVLNLVELAPGVVPQGSADGNLTGKNVFAAGNYQIGGGTANQSASYYDGVPLNITYGNLVGLVPSQEAVAEFRVQTNNNSAEYGRYTGGVVNMASKSGTNKFHGSLYEFLRNRSLNAGTFFANATGAGKPAFTQNQFGASLGGPIKKDKTFFFFDYQGYRQRQGALFLQTVPTAAMLAGDFSDYRNGSGLQIPIFDPLTNCGQSGNPVCTSSSGAQRTPFPGNVIPANRINPVSAKFATQGYPKGPVWALPNIPGQPFTHNFNFSKNVSTGGDNDQYNIRGDQNVSEKQRVLARYTHWISKNIDVDIFDNGIFYGDPYSPEHFTADQALLADTYSLTPTTIVDIRIGFMRWVYDRILGVRGTDLSKTLGLPSYFNQITALDGLSPAESLPPQISASGYAVLYPGRLAGRDTSYVITPSLIKLVGRHTLKFGGELRRMDINYYQNNTVGGTFSFDNLFTSQNALSPGATGNSIASFLLGYPSAGTIQTSPFTAGSTRYQGYYANDSFQATSKLTVNLGLRWEIPGAFTERFDRLATFDLSLTNPALTGVTVNGSPVKGAFVLVNSPGHPERGLRPEHYTLFAPRIGLAYRLSDKTVVRTGTGVFYIPGNVQFTESPFGNAVNYVNNVMVNSIDNQVTPLNTLSNPFPNGLIPPPGRDPSFQSLLLGGNSRTPVSNVRYGYTLQWNFTIQHQFPKDVALEAAYAGLRGIHLPQGGLRYDVLPTQDLPLGSQLQQQVSNPFYGLIANGVLSQPTVQRCQLLMPFPEYTSTPDPGGYIGNSVYHALQVKAEKRFASGGTVLASYTFSKIIANVETLTAWLDSPTGVAGVQDWYNFRGERALSSFDSRQRLALSYVVDFPIGKGQRFLSGSHGIADKLISGWGINGVSTFQEGFPLGLTATPNLTGFNTGLRPNVAAGCDKAIGGSAQSRINKWFNTACFTVPGPFTFGTEGRTDPVLRGPGVNNFDFALFKRTQIKEGIGIEFRAEAFNLFNRVQFGTPNTVATTAANATFGVSTTQANNPRLIQLALRLSY
jgi:hypothetical protein